MRLSNKSTFSLVCLIALFMLAAMPAMAGTIEGTWTTDRNNDNTADDPGWRITIGGLEANDAVTVTYLDRAGTAAADAGTQAGFAAVPDPGTSTTGQIEAALGVAISVQVVNTTDTVTYQRVDFPEAAPGATLASKTLVRLPKLMDLTTPVYYVSFGGEVTVTFDFADAVADTNGAPDAMLHVSDVTLGTPASWQYISVSGSNMITYRSAHAADAASVTSTVTLGAVFAQPADTADDGVATIHYDGTAPTITGGTITVAAAQLPTPPDSVWDKGFTLTFSVSDDSGGSGLPDTNPVRIDTDETKLEVVEIGLGTPDGTVDGTEYFVLMRPKADRLTTAGEPVTITVVPMDKAGNEGRGIVSVKLAASTPPAAQYMSAAPATGNVMQGATITVTFDKDPGTVTADNAAVSGTGNTRTLTVSATQAAGALAITLTWDRGRQVLNYNVVIPPVAAPTASPASGEITANQVITLTFAADPGTLTSSVGTVGGTGTTRTITLSNQAAGAVTITLGWDRGGSATLSYTVPADFVSANPTSPSNIMMVMIPKNSYVVLVRDMSATVGTGGLAFPDVPPVNGSPVNVMEWSDMPELVDLFDPSNLNHGGAIVLRKSADARDNDNAEGTGMYATPAVGSVGISEIMWARDLGQTNVETQSAGQWIELQNLNSKPVKILIYAQKGRDGLVSGGLLQNTAAGDSLLGNPGGMVIDAIQNIRNDGNQSNGGWSVYDRGQNGNSITGVHFASMHRILPDKQPAFSAAQNYTKRKGTNGGHWAKSGGAYLRSTTPSTSGGVTNVPILFDYRGTPGDVNNRTGITLHTKAGRTNLGDSPVLIFNEIGNRSDADKAYEWIEIRNTTNTVQSLKSYRITSIPAAGTENILYTFKHDKNADVPPNGVLLLVASDPAADDNHPLAIGYNIDKGEEDQVAGFKGAHVPRYKVMTAGNSHDNKAFAGIPNGGFVLVLRKPDTVENKNEDGKGPSEVGTQQGGDRGNVIDIAGHASVGKGQYPNPVSSTGLWPLYDFPGPGYSNNNIVDNTVHRRAFIRDNKDGDRFGTGAWGNNNAHSALRDAGWTGIGYRRDVTANAVHGGTPGYHGQDANLATGGIVDDVVISELMLSTGDPESRRKLPQWIEITNNSGTKVINLTADAGWRLVIETPGDAIRTLNFKAKGTVKRIYPKQTILIVAGSPTRNAQAGSDFLPSNIVFKSDRVFNVTREYGTGFSKIKDDIDDPRGALMNNDRYRFLNPKQFHIKLIDGKGNMADQVGNLDGNARTNDTADWNYPSGLTKEGDRTSFIRIYDDGMMARDATGSDMSDVLPLNAVNSGAVEQADLDLNDYDSLIPADYAWIQAAALNFDTIYVRHTWYGSETDYGTPGALKGQVLSVELSFFRPTLQDGKVTVRWTTESELDNAGFNILRSKTRDGEFTQVNAEMIQGAGTTGERTNYEWVDPTAKPDVVYYYQIEDVSFAGERQAFAITKLKGLISAENKLTTTWGELKEVQ